MSKEFTFPKPTNWQDFENFSWLLWRDMWGDQNAQKHGRPGQSQSGVDVFGRPKYEDIWHGVQCKRKDSNYGSALTTGEIEAEFENAKEFKPELAHLTIATTSPRDASIQKFMLKAKDRLRLPFYASVWSWDDICLELSFRQSVAIKLYPEVLTNYAFDPLEIEIPISDPHNRLQIGFTRPAVKDLLGPPMLATIRQIAAEVTDNAFRHGRATSATVKTRLDELIITDDGVAFDFTTAKPNTPSSAGGMGLHVVREFIQGTNAKVSWERKAYGNNLDPARGNFLRIRWAPTHAQNSGIQNLEYTVNADQLFMREASEVILTDIVRQFHSGNLHLRIQGIIMVSAFSMLVFKLLERLPTTANIYVYAVDEGYNRLMLSHYSSRVFFIPIPGE